MANKKEGNINGDIFEQMANKKEGNMEGC